MFQSERLHKVWAKNRRTRVAFRLVMIFVLAAFLAFPARGEIVINHFHNPGHGLGWTQWIQAQAKEFEALNPGVKIEINVPGQAMGIDAFLTQHASGIVMDVTELINSGGGTVAPMGVFHDLRPFFEKDPDIRFEDFAVIFNNALTTADGTLWGFPVDLFVVPTHYNADIFAEAGLASPLQLGSGWTYDAALDAAKKLTRDFTQDGQIDQWGTESGPRLWDWGSGTHNRGALFVDSYKSPQKSLVNSTQVVDALNWIADLYLAHKVTTTTLNSWGSGFRVGNIAWSTCLGPSAPTGMKQAGATFRYGVAMPIAGEKSGALVAINSFQIPTNADNPEMAWKWIKFLAGSDKAMDVFVQHTSRLPARIRAMPRWLEMVRALDNPPEGVENYVKAASHAENFTDMMGPKAAEIKSVLGGVFNKVITGEIAARVALEAAHGQVTTILNSN